jgi:hypothetical protein
MFYLEDVGDTFLRNDGFLTRGFFYPQDGGDTFLRTVGFLARGFFYPENGGDTFVRNVGFSLADFSTVGLHKIYTAPHPRRRYSS